MQARDRLRAIVWLTEGDTAALREAATALKHQADYMVTAYQARLGELACMAPCSPHPHGIPGLDYGTIPPGKCTTDSLGTIRYSCYALGYGEEDAPVAEDGCRCGHPPV